MIFSPSCPPSKLHLINELELLKRDHPSLFGSDTAYEEDPGLSYKLRVEERISRNPTIPKPYLDEELYWNDLNTTPKNRKPLPIDSKATEIAQQVRDNKFTIIVGGTGSGKSTRVPQIILRDEIQAKRGSSCRIICTQPRRLAASSIARRVAEEWGDRTLKDGQTVGYAIRGECVVPRKEGASILYCTTGVLVRKLINDPALIGVSHVIVDEIHERSLELEMLIKFLKDLAKTRRDFKFIAMSATMNEAYFQYLDNCVPIQVPSSMFDVQEYFLEDMRTIIGTAVSVVEVQEKRSFVVLQLVKRIVRHEPPGAILIFVPGWAAMKELAECLDNYNYAQCGLKHILKVRLLHSQVALEDHKVFDPIKGPGWKVLISTTIAESSITIPDVVYVIDTGKCMVSNFHTRTSATQEEFITKASAKQRAGRAGRVQPGTCYRLYTRAQYEAMPEHLAADKGNHNVTSVILNVLSLGESVEIFKEFANPPDPYHLDYEMYSLRTYRMIGPNNCLTLLGRRVNEQGADPLVAQMLIFGKLFGLGEQVATVSAGLATSCMFPMPEGHQQSRKKRKTDCHHKPPTRSELTQMLTLSRSSDALAIVDAVKQYMGAVDRAAFCQEYLLDQKSVEDVIRTTKLIQSELLSMKGAKPKHVNIAAVQSIIAAAFLPNLSWTKRNPTLRCSKFYLYSWHGYANAPKDSVVVDKQQQAGLAFTFATIMGVEPKLNLRFLNKLRPEAIAIFGADSQLDIIDVTDSAYASFLKNLRMGWQTLLLWHLSMPSDIYWDSPKGKLLDIIIKLLSD